MADGWMILWSSASRSTTCDTLIDWSFGYEAWYVSTCNKSFNTQPFVHINSQPNDILNDRKTILEGKINGSTHTRGNQRAVAIIRV